LNQGRTVRLTELGEVTAYADRGLGDLAVSFDPAYANMTTVDPGVTDRLEFRLVDEDGNGLQQEFEISVTSRFHMDFGYTVNIYPHLSWHSSEPGGGFSGSLDGPFPYPFQILRNGSAIWSADDTIDTSGPIHSDFRFTAQTGDVIGIRAGPGVSLEGGAALLTSHTWLCRGLFEFEMSILDEYGHFPEPDPPVPGSTITTAFQPLEPGWPRLFAVVEILNTGLGVEQPLWFDPEPSVGFEYQAFGLNMTSITLPGPGVGLPVIGDNLFDLWLRDPVTGEPEDTGIKIFGGVPFDLTMLHPEGVDALLISGVEQTPEYNPYEPGAFYTGLMFAGPGSVELRMLPFGADAVPPMLGVTLTPSQLWPPNHKLVTISADVTVSDESDPDPAVELVSITSNEPDSGLGRKDVPSDIQGAEFGTDDRLFALRAERSGTDSGRIYTVIYEARDISGNVSSATSQVLVPHDRRGKQ